MTLEDRVRHYVGEAGPQHESMEAYTDYINDQIDSMSNQDLLRWISMCLEEAGVVFPEKSS